MCGIVGILNPTARYRHEVLRAMTSAIAHRGPDGEGFYLDGPIALGHRRLSIIDLSTGNQPMFNEDRSVALVFNGEIYNYPQLRKQLSKDGHRFATKSDTETIVHLYEQYGLDCVNWLEGMFAFALWDAKLRRLVLARDRFGIKPLYYYFDGRKFLFASESKALSNTGIIECSINMAALSHYLTFNYIPAPLSAYKEIKKLLPGHLMTATLLDNGDIDLVAYRYYDLSLAVAGRRPVLAIDEAKVLLRQRLQEAVMGHMMSDVPLGAFLSGGIDSSIIVGLMCKVSSRPIKTFSIGYEGYGMFDETSYARDVASFYKTDHHEFRLTYRDILRIIPTVLDGLDEPFSDWSIFPTYLVASETRKHVKVALSGDGADEIFAGYRKYLGEQLMKYYVMFPRVFRRKVLEPLIRALPDSFNHPILERVRRAKRFISGVAESQAERHYRWMQILTDDTKEEAILDYSAIAEGEPKVFIDKLYDEFSGGPIDAMLYADVMFVLPYNMLVKSDSMSMLNSLEVRVPYLDRTVVETAFSFHDHLKLRGSRRKFVLIETFKDLLPKRLHNRPKQGFDVPIGQWFKKELKEQFWSVMDEATIKKTGVLNYASIKRLYDIHASGKRDLSKQLLNLFVLQWWLLRHSTTL